MNQKRLAMGARQFSRQAPVYFYGLLAYCTNTVTVLTNYN